MPAFRYLGEHGKGLLESALAEPHQTFEGRFLHRTIFDKAASLFRSIIKNHGLIDGNKRLALTTVSVFLTMNGYVLYVHKDQSVAMALRIASGDLMLTLREISRWLRSHSKGVVKLG